MKNVRLALFLALAAVTSAIATDAPYFGKWKVNSSKSQVNQIMNIEKQPSGDFRYESAGFIYTFQPDGKEYPAPDGSTVSFKASGDNVWDATIRANGKVSAKIKLTLNGDTISAASTIPQADGKEIAQTETLKRISGGPGFVGKWKPTTFEAGDFWIELKPDGGDGLKISAPNSLCVAKFDGKPYPMSGSGDGAKQTMSFRKKSPASFEAITYLDGKVFFTDVYSASADGKVLTDIGTPAATKKPVKTILDRQ
jgi:hypothetical protein